MMRFSQAVDFLQLQRSETRVRARGLAPAGRVPGVQCVDRLSAKPIDEVGVPCRAGVQHTGDVHRWALVSAGIAPVALIGGWTWAASVQPRGFDPLRDTISALAAHGVTDRWIMTIGLAMLGACHLVTAAGLPDAGLVSRALLMVGGAATIGVAALPQPSSGHVPAAALGFIALALWPAACRLPCRRSARGITVLLVAMLAWLAVELQGGNLLGLSERILAGTEALCPLALVLALLTSQRRPTRVAGSRAGKPSNPGDHAPSGSRR